MMIILRLKELLLLFLINDEFLLFLINDEFLMIDFYSLEIDFFFL